MGMRRLGVLAITGITIVAGALVTLSTTGAATAAAATAAAATAAAATASGSAASHLTAAQAAQTAADPSGCVEETFNENDQYTYEPCVVDEQILLNDIWSVQEKTGDYLGVNPQPLSVDGYYGPDTTSDVETFQGSHGDHVDGWTGPMTWDSICTAVYFLGFHGTYWNDAGCATEPGL
jgi:peptidoglycan hydrolase-like protein with peptidoglycan-binding domain